MLVIGQSLQRHGWFISSDSEIKTIVAFSDLVAGRNRDTRVTDEAHSEWDLVIDG